MMATRYATELGDQGDLYPGVLMVLDQLAERAKLALVTNGLGSVQRARLSRLGISDRFAAIVISGEVGVSKPHPQIFDIAFQRLGHPDRTRALMIGDSLSSDMAGASRYGIATCWYNRDGAPRPDSVAHEIRSLAELPSLIDRQVDPMHPASTAARAPTPRAT